MRSPSLQPASVLFKSVRVRGSDLLPSSVYDEERAAVVDGLCSSQFPQLCFAAAETKLHYCLILSHGHNATEALLQSRYRKLNDTVTSLVYVYISADIY